MGTRSGRKGMRRVAVSLYNIPLFLYLFKIFEKPGLDYTANDFSEKL